MIDLLFNIESNYFAVSLFCVGLLSGLVGAMGGPSGLIILPFMILGGFTPVMALGTARLAAFLPWVIAVSNFKKAGQIRMPELIYIAIIGFIAGIIGTYLVLDINEEILYPFIGVALMLAATLSFVSKDFGFTHKDYSNLRKKCGYGLYFIVMLYGGFFGAGAGVFAIFTLVSFLGFKMLEAHATHLTSWVIMSVGSCLIFMMNDQVDYFHALIILISMAIGSHFGSKLIILKGNKWIKILVSTFAFAVGLKLLLPYFVDF